MNFGQAIATGFGNYVKFSGRACRSEYWYWTLFMMIVGAVSYYVDVNIFEVDFSEEDAVGPMQAVTSLILFLPSLGVAIRRLHDIGRSGWWFLIVAVPLVGVIVLILWACKAGDPDANRFGPSPFATEEAPPPADAAS